MCRASKLPHQPTDYFGSVMVILPRRGVSVAVVVCLIECYSGGAIDCAGSGDKQQ